jgi:hypothetical protein
MKVNILGLTIAIILFAAFVISTSKSNGDLLSELTGSVSQPSASVSLCQITSDEVPSTCINIDKEFLLKATTSLPPSHAKSASKYFLKVLYLDAKQNENIKCFVLDKFDGVQDLYLSRINAGINCSSSSFKYLDGSLKVPNSLHKTSSVEKAGQGGF